MFFSYIYIYIFLLVLYIHIRPDRILEDPCPFGHPNAHNWGEGLLWQPNISSQRLIGGLRRLETLGFIQIIIIEYNQLVSKSFSNVHPGNHFDKPIGLLAPASEWAVSSPWWFWKEFIGIDFLKQKGYYTSRWNSLWPNLRGVVLFQYCCYQWVAVFVETCIFHANVSHGLKDPDHHFRPKTCMSSRTCVFQVLTKVI